MERVDVAMQSANGLRSLKTVAEELLLRWRNGWSELQDWAAVKGLIPTSTVSVVGEHGKSLLRMPGGGAAQGKHDQAVQTAVLLPESAILRRRVQLPLTSYGAFRSALQLDVETSTPFAPEDTVWGWRQCAGTPRGSQAAEVVISSKGLVRQCIESLGGDGGAVSSATNTPNGANAPEVWAASEAGHIVIQGFGEPVRLAKQRARMRNIVLMAVCAFGLFCALLLTPLLHKREQVIAANKHLASVSEAAGPAVALREELGRALALHETFSPSIDAEPDLIVLMDRVSATLPDGTWLDLFEFNPGVLRLGGRADDAAALIQAFQAQSGFRNVRAPSPIMREPQTGKERFVIEMEIAPI